MYNNSLCPTNLGIIMSYKCQSAWKHCRYNCGPKWKDWMSSKTLKEALFATRAWIHRFHIHFTGFDLYGNYIPDKKTFMNSNRGSSMNLS